MSDNPQTEQEVSNDAGSPMPVSGTVQANAGTNLNTSALALEATQSTQNTRIGDLTETAPASDTASSGLNGRLQRIAQRITSLIALIPTSLGQKTMANSFAVVLSSDQSAIPVNATDANVFSRINKKEFKDTEEARFDFPNALPNGFIYAGVAANGTGTSAAAWSIVRTSLGSSGNPERQQFRTGVAWDSRTSGW